MNQKEGYITELNHILLTKYVNGYLCGGYDKQGRLLMDGESKETPQEAVNSLLYHLNHPITEEESDNNQRT